MKIHPTISHLKEFGLISISICFHLFLCISADAQTDSLSHYLEIAVKNNPLVMQKYYEYLASVQKAPQVGSLPDPEFNAGVFLVPMELMDGKQIADFRLMQMFPWFGLNKAARDEMNLMAKAKFMTFLDAHQQLYFEVQRSWNELQKIKQNLRISRNNLEILQAVERLAVSRFSSAPAGNVSPSARPQANSSGTSSSGGSSGMQTMGGNQGGTTSALSSQSNSSMPANSMGSVSGTYGLTEVYSIQIEIAGLESNIELLISQFNSQSAVFNSLLNRLPSGKILLPDTLTAVVPSTSILNFNDSLLSKNPMMGMIEYEQQSLDARSKMLSKMGYPMMGLGVNYSLINYSEMNTSPMNGKDMIMPMFTATLPIYRKKYKAMQAEVRLLHSATEENCKATRNALQTEYYQALQSYQDAQRRMKLNKLQYQLASKSLDLLMRNFSSGAANLSDILRVQQQNLDYESKQMEAVADFNVAVAWLNRIVGVSQLQ